MSEIEVKKDVEPDTTEKTENQATDENDEASSQPLHPLQNTWSLWFFKNDTSKEWTDNLTFVVSVKTVEDFWAVYNHTAAPSRLPSGCDYSFFKKDIQPMWEANENVDGGSWLIMLDKSQRSSCLDGYWLNLLMMCIGEMFESDDMDEINGLVVNLRNKADRISIWTRNIRNEEPISRIGKRIKEQLSLDGPIFYNSHTDSRNKQGSKPKSLYTM